MSNQLFLQVSGITGGAVNAAHLGWINVVSYASGFTASATAHVSAGGGAGKPNFSDLTVVATVDAATAAITARVSTRTHIPTVKLSVCQSSGAQIEYFTIVLTDVTVTSAVTVGSQVTYLFKYAQINETYWPVSPSGAKGAAVSMSWNLAGTQAA